MEWGEEDDRAVQERERLAMLEVSQAAANLQEFMEVMQTKLQEDQEPLNHLEEQVRQTRDTTAQAVVILTEPASRKQQTQWILPSLGLAVLGGVALAGGGPVGFCAGRGVLFLGATLGSYSTLSKWQQAAIRQLQAQLPSAFSPLPADQVQMIQRASVEAKDRLLRKLDNLSREKTSSWQEEGVFSRLRTAVFQKEMTIRMRPSDARKDAAAYAYAVSFTARVPVLRAFQVMQRNMLSGSLDPGCKVMWTRPVEAEVGFSHSVRYLAFADLFFSREFFCTCFCGPVQSETERKASPSSSGISSSEEVPARVEKGARVECYAMAMMSLGEDLLQAEGLPKPAGSSCQGQIHVLGVRLTATSTSSTLVEVMIDADPAAPWPYTHGAINKMVRNHAKNVAWLLQTELAAAGAPTA